VTTTNTDHLAWIMASAMVAFTWSYVFTDLLDIPAPLYHGLYFAVVAGLVLLYVRTTRADIHALLRRRLARAVVFGIVVGLVLVRRVLQDPPSAGASGAWYAWDLVWRGVLYGVVDGVLLSAFPWLVVWRAFDGESASLVDRVKLHAVVVVSVVLMTSVSHAGYPEFRGDKLVQANVRSIIASLPTMVSGNPIASPIAHVILHVAAVTHSPTSDLFLPPHDRAPRR
jgi:hypothetical protein